MDKFQYEIINIEKIDDKNYKVNINIFGIHPRKKIFLIEFKPNPNNDNYFKLKQSINPKIDSIENNSKQFLINGSNFINNDQLLPVYFNNILLIINSNMEATQNLIKFNLPAQTNLGSEENLILYGVFDVTISNSNKNLI